MASPDLYMALDKEGICMVCFHKHLGIVCGADDWAPGPDGDVFGGQCICDEYVTYEMRLNRRIIVEDDDGKSTSMSPLQEAL